MEVISRNDLLAMTDSELNRVVSIKNTDFNRNRRYSSNTKNIWKSLHNGPLAMSYSEIAESWDASYSTVRKAIDPEYADKMNKAKVTYNKTYRMNHPDKRCTYDKIKDTIAHKRRIVSSENLAHLKSL